MTLGNLQAVFYRDSDGAEPVSDFIDRLEEHVQVSIDAQIDRLNLLSDTVPRLPFPHSSQVEGELRELRCHHGRRLYRVLYRRSDRLIILLHIFAKRGEAIPESEKRIARERWDDFRRRMDTAPREPPRAAGHDAP